MTHSYIGIRLDQICILAKSYNAQLTGVVMLATLLRLFAAKVPILRSPVEMLVRIIFCLLVAWVFALALELLLIFSPWLEQ
jgi:hypothetical protein